MKIAVDFGQSQSFFLLLSVIYTLRGAVRFTKALRFKGELLLLGPLSDSETPILRL